MEKVINRLTADQVTNLRDAVYAIADATHALNALNDELKADENWYAQGDIAGLAAALNELNETRLTQYTKAL